LNQGACVPSGKTCVSCISVSRPPAYSIWKMFSKEAAPRVNLDKIIRTFGAAPHSPCLLPMPRWCQQEVDTLPASQNELSSVGDLLKLYSRSTLTSPPESEPLSISSDSDHDAYISDTLTPIKLHVPVPDFPKKVRLPVLREREASSSPRSHSLSPEPEPSPASSIGVGDLPMPTPPQLQEIESAEGFLVAVLKQLAAKHTLSSWQPECEQAIQDLTSRSQRDLKTQKACELAAAGHGLSGYATVMIQQVPFKYTQSNLIREINGDGFKGTYDFFYLPANARNQGNRGFGFINFLSAELAEKFYARYHAQKLQNHEARMPIAVIPADVQGFEESVECFFSSWQLRKRKCQSMPVFLKPVPVRLQPQNRKGSGHLQSRKHKVSAKAADMMKLHTA